jgi:hypothetical protein
MDGASAERNDALVKNTSAKISEGVLVIRHET